jgi:hypothetical protein
MDWPPRLPEKNHEIFSRASELSSVRCVDLADKIRSASWQSCTNRVRISSACKIVASRTTRVSMLCRTVMTKGERLAQPTVHVEHSAH